MAAGYRVHLAVSRGAQTLRGQVRHGPAGADLRALTGIDAAAAY